MTDKSSDKTKPITNKHDWSVVKMGGVLCSKCRVMKDDGNKDKECKGGRDE